MQTSVNVLQTIDIIAIVSGIVGALISLIAFFASIIFYIQGKRMQEEANKALILIQEKSSTIEDRFGGMFDKTLEAALSMKTDVSEEFEPLQQRLQESAKEIMKQVASEIQGIGKEQKDEILNSVKKQFDDISTEIIATKESLFSSVNERLQIPSLLSDSEMNRKIFMSIEPNKEYRSMSVSKSLALHQRHTVDALKTLVALGLLKREIKGSFAQYSLTNNGYEVRQILKNNKK